GRAAMVARSKRLLCMVLSRVRLHRHARPVPCEQPPVMTGDCTLVTQRRFASCLASSVGPGKVASPAFDLLSLHSSDWQGVSQAHAISGSTFNPPKLQVPLLVLAA